MGSLTRQNLVLQATRVAGIYGKKKSQINQRFNNLFLYKPEMKWLKVLCCLLVSSCRAELRDPFSIDEKENRTPICPPPPPQMLSQAGNVAKHQFPNSFLGS